MGHLPEKCSSQKECYSSSSLSYKLRNPSSEKANHVCKVAQTELVISSVLSLPMQCPKYSSLNQTLGPKTAPSNTQASPVSAPTKAHPEPDQIPATYLPDGQRACSLDLLSRPQNNGKLASIFMASKSHDKTWRPETIDRWWGKEWPDQGAPIEIWRAEGLTPNWDIESHFK